MVHRTQFRGVLTTFAAGDHHLLDSLELFGIWVGVGAQIDSLENRPFTVHVLGHVHTSVHPLGDFDEHVLLSAPVTLVRLILLHVVTMRDVAENTLLHGHTLVIVDAASLTNLVDIVVHRRGSRVVPFRIESWLITVQNCQTTTLMLSSGLIELDRQIIFTSETVSIQIFFVLIDHIVSELTSRESRFQNASSAIVTQEMSFETLRTSSHK